VVDLPLPVGPVTSTRPLGQRAELLDRIGGDFQVLKRQNLGGDQSEDATHAAMIAEQVRAKAPRAFQRVGKIRVVAGLELLQIVGRRDLEEQLFRALRCQFLVVSQGHNGAVLAKDRLAPRGDVQVRSAMFHHQPEVLVDLCHKPPS
jgi:hypothetical protein